MTIRDLGNIKWTSLMLPEHVKMLRHYFHEEYHDVPEPVMDEQKLEEMNGLIMESMENSFPLSFTVYENKRLLTLNGSVQYMDQVNHLLRVIDEDGRIHKLPFASLKDVKRL